MENNPYESSTLVSEYLLFHYGTPSEILPYQDGPSGALGFPERAVTELIDRASLPANVRALDLGCAVGRSCFTLSAFCEEVIGIDFSHAFIAAAQTLARSGRLDYTRRDEGDLGTPLTARVPEEARPECVSFHQGDAMELRSGLGTFDVILAANLICRLPDPETFLRTLVHHIRPGGQLLLTSPYTWLDDFTPRPRWLGGYHRHEDGCALYTAEALDQVLGGHFQRETTIDLPLLIRETARKYQWTVAQGTRWRRRPS